MTTFKLLLEKRIIRRFRRSRAFSRFKGTLNRHVAAPFLRGILHPSGIQEHRSFPALRLLWDMPNPPLLSVLMPIYKPDLGLFKKAVSSVQRQCYPNWELCLVDDGSNDEHLISTFQNLEGDARIKVFRFKMNEGISAAINKAAALANGSYFGVLDQDDELHSSALLEYARVITRNPEVDIIYCDEDKIDEKGRFCSPWYKSDWNPDMALSFNYVMHFVLYRSSLFRALGGTRTRFDGSQDYDLLLRAVEKTGHIHHIPKILYHWRISAGSIAGGPEAKPHVFVKGLAALNDALHRREIQGSAEHAPDAWKGVYRVRRKINRPHTTSILVLLTGNPDRPLPLFRSIAALIPSADREIICMDPSIPEAGKTTMVHNIPITCVASPDKALNNVPAYFNAMARKARGDFLLFLDDTMEILSSETHFALLEQGQRSEVGAVGGKVFYPNGFLEQTGIILGPFGLFAYANRASPDDVGYVGIKRMIANYSAIMGLGMMTRRLLFFELGGFDEQYDNYCWDADYCLRLRERRFLITSTPYATFRHYIPARPTHLGISSQDTAIFKKRWHHVIDNDPYFNKNLSRLREDFWPG